MTRRERLEMVIKGEINDELIEDCKRELEKLDMKLASIAEKAKTTENYVENKEYEERILVALGAATEPMQIDELGEKVNSTLSRQRLTAICTNLIREGKIKSCDVKVKGKGKRKAYYM